MPVSPVASDALAIAGAISLRSCASSSCANGPRCPLVCPPAPVCGCDDAEASVSAVVSSACTSSAFCGCAGSGCAKNRSKQAPSAFFSSSLLASVNNRLSRSTARSARPTAATARIASMLSAGETCTPAPRAARKKRCRFSCMSLSEHVLPLRLGDEGRHLRQRNLDVGFVFEQHVERVPHHVVTELGGLQQHQYARPVDGLADRGLLLQIERADVVNEADQLPAQGLRDAGQPALDDALLQLLLGEADMQMQAAALQGVAEIALAVGGQDHGRWLGGRDAAELGNRYLEVGEDFEQQRLELGIRFVDLIDQEHAALRLEQRLQQRPRLDEFAREEHVTEIMQLVERGMQRRGTTEHLAKLVLEDLGVAQLLGEFPLIPRLSLVQPLIALQADHLL